MVMESGQGAGRLNAAKHAICDDSPGSGISANVTTKQWGSAQ